MGNIKHNDELLRVHDDGFDVVFNCDNKHQNGVSYHAEKNGKKTKIDPEYAMAALVKKVSGAGWPSDLPAPSAGGYGYTEQGEQAESEIVHKINEKYLPEPEECRWPEDMPVPSVGGYGYTEQDEQTIFDGTVSYAAGGEAQELTHEYDLVEGQSYNVTFNGTEYNNLVAFNDGGYISIGAAYGSGYDVYPFHIENAEVEYVGEGICFYTERPGDYSLVITTNEEVVHKINEQYLPSGSGGVLVVSITANSDYTLTASHTPNQVKTAMLAGTPVVGVLTDNADGHGEVIPLGSAVWNHFIDEEGKRYDAGPAFAIYSPQPGLMFVKNWNQDKWEFTWWFENDD